MGTIKSDITCLVVSLVWDVLELEIQLALLNSMQQISVHFGTPHMRKARVGERETRFLSHTFLNRTPFAHVLRHSPYLHYFCTTLCNDDKP